MVSFVTLPYGHTKDTILKIEMKVEQNIAVMYLALQGKRPYRLAR